MNTDRKKLACGIATDKLLNDLESLDNGVETIMEIARHGEDRMLESAIRQVVERAIIAGYSHGQTAYSVWATEFNNRK